MPYRLLACLGATLLIAAAPVPVDTPQGKVAGRGDGAVESFKGLPYAAPPVGDARWRAPGPAPHWADIRDASAPGPVCIQRAPASSAVLAKLPQSEDCLSLNIWRPVGAKAAPVMVWIHGGANVFGSGAEPYYDGAAFAKRGIVLVTINYRLGYLGFFGHPALKGGGGDLVNYGLLDQIAALKWVRDNIAAYGGDPARVTVFGESAGGGAVLNLLASPSARGLFARAVVESGGGLILKKTVATADAQGKTIVGALGLGSDVTAAALRALPAASFVDPRLPPGEPGFGAVIGGAELPEAPLSAIRAGRAAQVPLMIGVNSNEGSLTDSYRMSDDQVLALLGGQLPAISDAYGSVTGDKSAYAHRLYGDIVFLYPARSIARAQSAKSPVWLYYFDYVPDALRAQRRGVNHAGEIPFVFHTPASTVAVARSDKDKAFASGVNSCWAAFATSGKPSDAPFCKGWSGYDAKRDGWFAFRDAPAPVEQLSKRQLDAAGAVLRRLGLD